MSRLFTLFVFSCVSLLGLLQPVQSSPWGEQYFPNTTLITHEGKPVKFFDDLIKDKVVAINFIYTSCPDVCPLETAQLIRVQRILGDKLGKDIHFYSISIDPEVDTPEVLADYRERFRASWTFLTGDRQEIIELRRKLGLYVEGADQGDNNKNHNVSMIIGNQSTGRWMKRSPFENAHVLADQLENWLTGWKHASKGKDYANAPKLRKLENGEPLFRTRCSSCHTIDGSDDTDLVAPDLLGVASSRPNTWLTKWLLAPDKMIAEQDPVALALLKKYNNIPMPNLRLNHQEVAQLIDFMHTQDKRYAVDATVPPDRATPKATKTDQLAVMNAWVKEAHPKAGVNAGYMKLINPGKSEVTLISAHSEQFESVEFHEMSMDEGMMMMNQLHKVSIGPNHSADFVPGGKHLMLRNPHAPLKAGDSVNISLEFSSGEVQQLTLEVLKVDQR